MSVQRRRTGRLRANDEGGMTLIIVAASLVALLVFAALAIDLGALFNERRQDQNAVDSGSLGGLQDLIKTDDAAIDAAISLVNNSFDGDVLGAEWNMCGTASTTGDTDNIDSVLTHSVLGPLNCITANFGRTRLQIRLPERIYETNFGGLVGLDQLAHSAFAIAEITSVGFGDILPYGIVLGAGTDGGHICVRSGPDGIDIPPCQGPDAGNFGIIDLGIWDLNDCSPTPAAAKDRQDDTTAVGLDHILSVYGGVPWGTTEITDTPNCGANPRPNAALVGPGNSHNETGSGLWSGSGFGIDNTTPARLRQSDPNLFDGAGATVTFTNASNNYVLDDNPIWKFIPASFTTAAEVPDSCHGNVFTNWLANAHSTAVPDVVTRTYLERDHPDVNEQMRLLVERCMLHYQGFDWHGNGQRLNGDRSTTATDKPYTDLSGVASSEPPSGCSVYPCTGDVFTVNSSIKDDPDLWDIQYTPRFGYVPVLWDPFPPGNSGTVRFKSFRPIFIQRVCMGSNNCDIEFEPGIPGFGGPVSGGSTSSFTAYMFPIGMLPGDLDSDGAAFKIGLNQVVRLLR